MDNRQQVHDWNEEFFIYLKIAKERHLLSNFDTNLKMQIFGAPSLRSATPI